MAILAQQTETTGDYAYCWGSYSGGRGAAQDILVSGDASIESIDLLIGNLGTYVGNISIQIRHISTGELLATTTVNVAGWSTTPEWRNFPLAVATCPALMEIQVNGALDARVKWMASANDPLASLRMTGWGPGHPIPENWDACFKVNGTTAGNPPSKPVNPSPANGATAANFTSFTFSWDNGGGATSYKVYIGDSQYALNHYADVGTDSYTPGDGSAAKSFILAVQDVIYWRVDAVNDNGTTTGDVWSFDPRPAQVTYVAPEDGATDQTLHQGAEWNSSSAAETYTFRIVKQGGIVPTVLTGLTVLELESIDQYLHLDRSTTYDWRVDAVNQFGITEGDVWRFTTISLKCPCPSYELISGGSGQGPYGDPPGVVDIDFRWVGDNMMVTTRRLVAAAYNRIWYEEV